MKSYEIKTDSEIKGSVNKAKKNKKSIVSKIIDVLLVIFIIVSFLVSGSLLYFKLRYVACFVSGMSMYPTLNVNGTTSEGHLFNPESGNESSLEGSVVDFLLADEKDNFKDKIERFDIVCSFYPSDNPSYSTEKIKRVIGLPGERVWLVTSSEEDSKYTGTLYVSEDQRITPELAALGPSVLSLTYDIKKIDQPLHAVDYDNGVKAYSGNTNSQYHYGNAVTYAYYWVLDGEVGSREGEYILLGDNRANSNDSRSVGPINSSLLTGRVVSCIGKSTITEGGKNAKFKISSFRWRSL